MSAVGRNQPGECAGSSSPSRVDTLPRVLVAKIVAAWLLARLALLVLLLPLALRWTSVQRMVPLLTPAPTGEGQPAPPSARVLSTGLRVVDTWSDWHLLRVSGSGTCLRRSLALYYLATHCGYAPEIVLGIRQAGAAITGHAWLELDGRPFLEDHENPAQRFTVVHRLPAKQAQGSD